MDKCISCQGIFQKRGEACKVDLPADGCSISFCFRSSDMGSGDVEPEKSGKEDSVDRCGAGSEKNTEVGDAWRQWRREQAGLRHLGYGPAEEMEYGSDCTYLSTATEQCHVTGDDSVFRNRHYFPGDSRE